MSQAAAIVRCAQCGKSNRRPWSKVSAEGKCGACKTPLPYLTSPVAVGDEGTFADILASSDVPVLVDFWADWCGPCHMMAPALDQVARERAGNLLVLKVDTERARALAGRYQIRSLPTLVLLRHGKEVARTSGARPAAAIASFVDAA